MYDATKLLDSHSWSREVRGDSHHSPVTGFSPAYFATPAVTVNEGQEYDIDTLQTNLLHKVDQWNKRSPNFNIERVSRFAFSIHPYRPLHGSTFVRTPDFMANKHCLINVQNNDEKCFVWSVLSALYPATHHPYRLLKYKTHEHSLKVEGLTFPVQTKQIPLFEKNQALHIHKRFCIRGE